MKETDSTVRNPKTIEENCFTTYFNNAFQQQKKALNKRTRFESNPKPVNTSRNEWFDENPISTSRKKLLPLNLGKWFQRAGMIFFKNWPTFIFKNGVHYRKKKALNKRKRFAIDQKTVSNSRNEGFVEKYDFTGPKNCFHLKQCLNKLNKTVYTSKNKILWKILSLL